MKKTLYIIGALMFLTALASPQMVTTVFGQDGQSQDDSGCAGLNRSCIFSKFTNLISGGKDWTDTFGSDDPAKAGQNLYSKIYDLTLNQPEEQAFKNTAGKYGTTEAEMAQIVDGNFTAILGRKPNLTQEELFNKMSEIQEKFLEESDILGLQADINSTVQPNEMFANGDVSDSGFDLVNDLRMIETILFKKSDPIDIGASIADSGAGFDSVASALAGAAPGNSFTGAGTPAGNAAAGKGGASKEKSAASDGATTDSANSSGAGNAASGGADPAGFNPNSCYADNSIDKALDQFAKDNQQKSDFTSQNPNAGNGSASKENQNAATSAGASSAAAPSRSPANKNTADPNEDPLPAVAEPLQAVTPAPAAKWLKNPPCTDVFCITLQYTQKPVSLYQISDNCIACHIEKINEKLKETIGHNLTPGKATGNLLEPGVCKKAAFNLLNDTGLNFYAISKPVQTPPNDDLIYGVGLAEEWKRYITSYKPFPFAEKGPGTPADPNTDPFPPNALERATESALTNGGPGATFSDVQQAIDDELSANAAQQTHAVAIAENSLQSDTDAGFYKSIIHEVDQMNYYFDLFQNILHSLHEPIKSIPGQQACIAIKQKKECE